MCSLTDVYKTEDTSGQQRPSCKLIMFSQMSILEFFQQSVQLGSFLAYDWIANSWIWCLVYNCACSYNGYNVLSSIRKARSGRCFMLVFLYPQSKQRTFNIIFHILQFFSVYQVILVWNFINLTNQICYFFMLRYRGAKVMVVILKNLTECAYDRHSLDPHVLYS